MELASEVLYVLCKYADFFLCTAQTNVFGAKIGMSAKRSIWGPLLEGVFSTRTYSSLGHVILSVPLLGAGR